MKCCNRFVYWIMRRGFCRFGKSKIERVSVAPFNGAVGEIDGRTADPCTPGAKVWFKLSIKPTGGGDLFYIYSDGMQWMDEHSFIRAGLLYNLYMKAKYYRRFNADDQRKILQAIMEMKTK